MYLLFLYSHIVISIAEAGLQSRITAETIGETKVLVLNQNRGATQRIAGRDGRVAKSRCVRQTVQVRATIMYVYAQLLYFKKTGLHKTFLTIYIHMNNVYNRHNIREPLDPHECGNTNQNVDNINCKLFSYNTEMHISRTWKIMSYWFYTVLSLITLVRNIYVFIHIIYNSQFYYFTL